MNERDEHLEREDCEGGRTEHTSASNLLLGNIEEKNSMRTAMHWAALDLGSGRMASLRDIDEFYQHPMYMLRSGWQ